MTVVPLRRNRDFVLLQAGQLLSNAGTQSTAIAYPLLVLAQTHSPLRAGLVSFARALPLALLALPAGAVADRWSRKRVMIGADAVRVAAIGTLATLVLTHTAALWAIALVAFVEGIGATFFNAAQPGALRAVVPRDQLPAAAGVQSGRQAAVQLTGPPVGAALFEAARALPFFVDAFSYAFSTSALLLMRAPFEEERARDTAALRTRLAEGIRFVWSQPFVRTCAFLYGLTNFIGPGLLFAIVVLARRQGLPAGAVGLLVAAFGACLLIGSFLSPLVRRHLPVRAVLLLELWTWVGCAAFLIWPDVYVLAAALLPTALAIPSTDSVVNGYRIAITPDRLQGRAESVRSALALMVASLGPLVAGVLLADTSPRWTITVFAMCGVALAVWGTLSPALRTVDQGRTALGQNGSRGH